MADEPDNHTLRLLREMREETNRRFDEMHEATNRRFDAMEYGLDEMRRDMHQGLAEVHRRHEESDKVLVRIIDAVTGLAKVQERHSQILGVTGSRLNAIDHRLALIEERTGLVKA
jgi:hypothetical protein